ncbi:hypothetical protein [Leuconostoc palmae]|uniref:hypothetical protein n=1 Tax=Leuconostoc palmae TaxID=501487 RepID=UPI001C7D706F|nr:hypothetical protein [Leuconostoc palmae]
MTDKNYQRPKFQPKHHFFRNLLVIFAMVIIITLSIFIFVGYNSSQKTSTPIVQKASHSQTINETVDSNTRQDEQSVDGKKQSSSSNQSNSSSRKEKTGDTRTDANQLKNKSLSEAINWAKAHGRYYSWSITSGTEKDAIVINVQDDGQNIHFDASSK